MTAARIEANRRRKIADIWYGIGIILAGAIPLAFVLTWGV